MAEHNYLLLELIWEFLRKMGFFGVGNRKSLLPEDNTARCWQSVVYSVLAGLDLEVLVGGWVPSFVTFKNFSVMSVLSHIEKHSFAITFVTLFVGMHYGWHLLQLKPEVNQGQPPKEFPATTFVKYLYKKVTESGEIASIQPATPVPAASKQ